MALLQETRLGPYEVIAPLGSGGMGEVYRARDTRLGREVAIKVLFADKLSDPARRARFVQDDRLGRGRPEVDADDAPHGRPPVRRDATICR